MSSKSAKVNLDAYNVRFSYAKNTNENVLETKVCCNRRRKLPITEKCAPKAPFCEKIPVSRKKVPRIRRILGMNCSSHSFILKQSFFPMGHSSTIPTLKKKINLTEKTHWHVQVQVPDPQARLLPSPDNRNDF